MKEHKFKIIADGNGIIVRNADTKKYFFVSKTLADKAWTVVREDK